MELLRVIRSVGYAKLEPPIPALGVEVTEPTYGKVKKMTVPLDTGFAGYLMLPDVEYAELSAAEAPREEFGSYGTMAGPVVTRRARVLVTVDGRKFESFVETPLYGGGKHLMGRRILNQLDVALLGGLERACLVTIEKTGNGEGQL